VTRNITQTKFVSNREFVKAEGEQLVSGNRIFKARGFNYYPRDYGWRIFKAWDKDEVSRELNLASELNCNCIRTFVNYQYSTNNVNYEQDFKTFYPVDSDYVARIQEFLDLADGHGYGVILSLFEYVYWDLLKPQYYWIGEKYLEELLPQFSDDPRILAWDIINEPDLKDPFSQPGGQENVTTFLKKMSQKIRDLDKNHLITVGVGRSENLSKISDIDKFTDFISFHDYDDPSKLRAKISTAKQFKKPVVLGEFGRHTYASDPVWPQTETDQAECYNSVLPIVKQTNIAGSLFWTLMDFPVANIPSALGPVYNGKESIENHYGIYRLDYTPKPAKSVVQRFNAQY